MLPEAVVLKVLVDDVDGVRVPVTLGDADTEADGEPLGDAVTLADGVTLAVPLVEGVTDTDGVTLRVVLGDGLVDLVALGLTLLLREALLLALELADGDRVTEGVREGVTLMVGVADAGHAATARYTLHSSVTKAEGTPGMVTTTRRPLNATTEP